MIWPFPARRLQSQTETLNKTISSLKPYKQVTFRFNFNLVIIIRGAAQIRNDILPPFHAAAILPGLKYSLKKSTLMKSAEAFHEKDFWAETDSSAKEKILPWRLDVAMLMIHVMMVILMMIVMTIMFRVLMIICRRTEELINWGKLQHLRS